MLDDLQLILLRKLKNESGLLVMFQRSIFGLAPMLFGLLCLAGCDSAVVAPTLTSSDVQLTEKERTSGVVLLKFGATWCGPCKQLDKEFEQLEASLAGRVKLLKIDVDEEPKLADQYNVSSIPYMVLFENGKAISEQVGFMSADEIDQWIADSTTTPSKVGT